MEFRPCIDIHNGKVKQIVGSSLQDKGNQAEENFVSKQDAAFYAKLYQKSNLKGGHIILLNKEGSEYYEATKNQALLALQSYPKGMQVGGGIHQGNAEEYLLKGASQVIVTSYVFQNGTIHWEHLKALERQIGREQLVLDLSCRKKNGTYYIVTDRWQKFTEVELTNTVLDEFASYCSEFLIHAVDVEGKAKGIEKPLVALLGNWRGIPTTYAGGVGSLKDLQELKDFGQGFLNVTIGSALDIFGGTIPYEEVLKFVAQ